MNTEELLENLLYSALYPRVYRWRRSSDASQPPDSVLRVFVRMELRLQNRYGWSLIQERVTAFRAAESQPWFLRRLGADITLGQFLMNIQTQLS